MAFQMHSDDDSIYLSAPTNPTTPYLENLNVYSAPASPILHAYKPTSDPAQAEPTTPKSCTYDYYDDNEDENNNFIEFEFETSRCYTPDDYDFDQMVHCFESLCQQNTRESLPAMAFADELFRDGKVMPLNSPPHLQGGSYNNVSSCLCSPKSPTAAAPKLPFTWGRLLNDDFDPFMVALEKIKRGNREMRNEEKDQRRARSVSLLRATRSQWPSKSMSAHHSDINRPGPDKSTLMERDGPLAIWARYQNRKIEQESKKSPTRLGESKGVLNAGQTRPVKMRHEKAKTGESGGKESEESRSRGSKREGIKQLLFRFASIGRANNEEKQKDQSVKKRFTRKLDLLRKVLQ